MQRSNPRDVRRSKTPPSGTPPAAARPPRAGTPNPRSAPPPVPVPLVSSPYRATPTLSEEELDFVSLPSSTPRRLSKSQQPSPSRDLQGPFVLPGSPGSSTVHSGRAPRTWDELGVGWSHTVALPTRCVEPVGGHVWVCDRTGALSLRTPDGAFVRPFESRAAATDSFVTCLLLVAQTVWAGYSKPMLRVFDAATGGLLHSITHHHSGAIHCLAQRDGFVYSGGADFRVCQWDAHSWEYCKQYAGHSTGVRVILPDEDQLYTAGDDCLVRVWRLAAAQQVAELAGHQKGVKCMVRTADHLWSGSEDFSIRVWRLGDWQCVKVLDAHLGPVTALAVVGDRVWSGSKDGIKLWNAATLRLLGEYCKQDSYVTSIRVTRRTEECRVWTIASDNTIAVWDTKLDLSLDGSRPAPAAAQPPKEAFYTVRKALEARVADVLRERDEANQQRDDLRARCAGLDGRLQRAEQAQRDAEAQARSAQEALQRLREELAGLQVHREQVSVRAAGTATTLLLEKEQELAQLRQQVARLKEEVLAGTQRAETLQRQVGAQQAELRKKEERLVLLQRVQDANDGTIKEFNQKFQQALALKSALETALKERDAQLAQTTAEHKQFGAVLQEREQALLQVQQRLEATEDEKSTLQEQLKVTQIHHSYLEQERHRLEEEGQALRHQLDMEQSNAHHMSILLKGQQERITELEEFRTNHLPVPPQHREFVAKTRGMFVRRVVALLEPLGHIERVCTGLSKDFQRVLMPLGRIAAQADALPHARSPTPGAGPGSDAAQSGYRALVGEVGAINTAAQACCDTVIDLYELARSTQASIRLMLDTFLTDAEKLSAGVTVKRPDTQVSRDAEKLPELLRQLESAGGQPRADATLAG